MLRTTARERSLNLLKSIVEKLDTSLNLPEEEVIKQDDSPDAAKAMMYFVGQGDCKVMVRDHKGRDVFTRSLYEGDHFGEIALIYKCKRSATVISSNYNTLATLQAPRFRELVSEFPEYEEALKQHLREEYGDRKDPKLIFYRWMVMRVDYMEKISDETLYDVIFSLASKDYESGTVILAEEQLANSLFFVEQGMLEIYTQFEGNEFIIEKLHAGSAVNHRAYFMQDPMAVNVRCTQQTRLLELPNSKIKEIQEKHSNTPWSNNILFYQNRILKQDKKFPVDYIQAIPKSIPGFSDEMASRELTLKNVVMRIIIEIRERKKRPKLSDFLKVYKSRQNEKDAKDRFKKKFQMLYAGEANDTQQEDPKFRHLMQNFDRIQKQLSQQQQALSHLVKRVNNLIEHRERREEQISKKQSKSLTKSELQKSAFKPGA